ncbi:Tigger transposable element-derived protein 4 [Trichinella sp. T6]|nr:Tigger transposable element-derived protein 4 [Trichinella sp. T6]
MASHLRKGFAFMRKPTFIALMKWFRGKNFQTGTQISGPILKIKAEQFATMLGYTDFTCTTGWLDQFEARHNICSGRLCGKARSSNTKSVDSWFNSVWPALRQQYKAEGKQFSI